MLEASAGDEARVELARVFWSQGQHEKARGLLEDITLVDPSSVPAQALLGWVILSQVCLRHVRPSALPHALDRRPTRI